MQKILGIDATNIKSDGGIRHIIEILNYPNPKKREYFDKIIIWGNKNLLKKIKNDSIIKKVVNLDSVYKIFFWFLLKFPSLVKTYKCTKVFIPGGIYFGNKPHTCLVQNLVPFCPNEIKKYNFKYRIKNFFLKKIYINTFERASSLIFLNKISKKIVLKEIRFQFKTIIIPHGINKKIFFFKKKKTNKKINVLYNSSIEPYKNHKNIILAVNKLIQKKYNLKIVFLGAKNVDYYKNLESLINFLKIKKYIYFKYANNQKEVVKFYRVADIKIFASTCESFGMSILESMAIGVPVLASNFEGNKELLGKHSIYFDPTSINSIVSGFEKIMSSSKLRNKLSLYAYNSIKKKFDWKQISTKTIRYIFEN